MSLSAPFRPTGSGASVAVSLGRRSALALAGCIAVARVGRAVGATGLGARLAELSGLPASEAFDNLPPRSGFLPGTLLNPDGSLLEAGIVQDGQALKTGLSASAELDGSSLLALPERIWVWPSLCWFRDRISVSATAADGTLYATGAGAHETRLKDSKWARDLMARGSELFLIDRIWQARVSLEISRGSGTGDDDWAELIQAVLDDMDRAEQRGAFEAGEHDGVDPQPDSADPGFRLNLGKSVTCAFSMVRLSRRAGPVTATRVGAAVGGRPAYVPVTETASVAMRPWTLATVSSGYYSDMATMNQPWNATSAEVAASALRSYRPTAVRGLAATPTRPLTRDLTLAFARDAARDAKSRRARLMVFYYIGHMVTYDDNALALLMGDAGRTRVAGGRTEGLESMGGNLADLARAMVAIGRRADPPRGELELADLYEALASGGVPFILLVDGCMQAEAFAAFRERLGLVIGPHQESELFVGPGSAPQALRRFTDGLMHFADGQSYLSSRNPVVLGSAPGTVANPLRNPVWEWGAPAGSLGQLRRQYRSALQAPGRPPLAGPVAELVGADRPDRRNQPQGHRVLERLAAPAFGQGDRTLNARA